MTEADIIAECREIEKVLIEKNIRYGDSAENPIRVFSKLPPEAGIRVRIDDKLSRLRSNLGGDPEDTILDLIGYLILLRIVRAKNPLTKIDPQL